MSDNRHVRTFSEELRDTAHRRRGQTEQPSSPLATSAVLAAPVAAPTSPSAVGSQASPVAITDSPPRPAGVTPCRPQRQLQAVGITSSLTQSLGLSFYFSTTLLAVSISSKDSINFRNSYQYRSCHFTKSPIFCTIFPEHWLISDYMAGILTVAQAQALYDSFAPQYTIVYNYYRADVTHCLNLANLNANDEVLDFATRLHAAMKTSRSRKFDFSNLFARAQNIKLTPVTVVSV